MKVCNIFHDDWDEKIPTVLWDYHTTCKHLTKHTPFCMIYGKEAVIPIEFLVSSLCIIDARASPPKLVNM